MLDMRYLKNEDRFLGQSWEVYKDYYFSRGRFLTQYSQIPTSEKKNLFLMIVSSYRYLVRDGQYRLLEGGKYIYLNHLDITYKFISMMSLIEALFADDEFIDFYQWLSAKERRKRIFPIADPQTLDELYRKYKDEYGARKALRFFNELDESAQSYLAARVKINNHQMAAEAVAQKLYVMRSEFVHQARLVLEFNEGLMFSRRAGKVVYSMLSFQDLQLLFEHGILQHFGMTPDEKKI
jgi:hypothetical protein